MFVGEECGLSDGEILLVGDIDMDGVVDGNVDASSMESITIYLNSFFISLFHCCLLWKDSIHRDPKKKDTWKERRKERREKLKVSHISHLRISTNNSIVYSSSRMDMLLKILTEILLNPVLSTKSIA